MSENTETTTTTTSTTSEPSTSSSALSSSLADLAKGKEATPVSGAASASTHNADPVSQTPGKDESGKDIPVTKTEDAEYELEVAEDSVLTQEDLEEIVKIAEEQNLNKVQAENLIKQREQLLKKGYSKAEAKIQEEYKKAQSELMAHPEFTGEKKVKSFESINRAVSMFGDDQLIAALNRPDIGNNLALALFLKKIGDMVAPDSIEGKGSQLGAGANEANKEAALKKLYPDFYKNV